MEATTIFNPVQKHLLQMFRHLPSEAMLDEMKNVLMKYYASKTQAGIDKFWEENNMGEGDINAILNEHLRTPYNQGE